jgi:uncharacterized protein (DUF305 family)
MSSPVPRRTPLLAAILAIVVASSFAFAAQAQGTGQRAPAAPAQGQTPMMMQHQQHMQGQQMPMPQGQRPGAVAPSQGSSETVIEAFQAANDRMHRDMNIPFTGNAERDFAASMIPHHQGAIDMARILLRHGRDSQLRRLAQSIIAAQEREIRMLRQWLDRNPG